MQRVYISGPVTGVEDYKNHFLTAEYRLKRAGYSPVNPVKIIERAQTKRGRALSHDECMKICLRQVASCDGMYMLKGWPNSSGAREERELAIKRGLFFVRLVGFTEEKS